MADFAQLRRNDFWQRKFRRAVEVHDLIKCGSMSRADFEVVVNRYRKLDTATSQHAENLSQSLLHFADVMGFTNPSVKMSYDDYRDTYLKVLSAEGAKLASPNDKLPFGLDLFLNMFSNLDLNGDGVITFNEWRAHYQCMGIDTAHARASFNAMDKSGEGKITKQQFVNYQYEYWFTAENKFNSEFLYGPL